MVLKFLKSLHHLTDAEKSPGDSEDASGGLTRQITGQLRPPSTREGVPQKGRPPPQQTTDEWITRQMDEHGGITP